MKKLVRVLSTLFLLYALSLSSSFAQESIKASSMKEYVEKLNKWRESELIMLNKHRASLESNKIQGMAIDFKNELLKRCNGIPYYLVTQLKGKPNKLARDFCFFGMEYYNNTDKYIRSHDSEVKNRAENQYNKARKILEHDIVKELFKLQNPLKSNN